GKSTVVRRAGKFAEAKAPVCLPKQSVNVEARDRVARCAKRANASINGRYPVSVTNDTFSNNKAQGTGAFSGGGGLYLEE
ncbi:MAG TPA: hypothetical protein VH575_05925, partial [Gemmataceae bacterium]